MGQRPMAYGPNPQSLAKQGDRHARAQDSYNLCRFLPYIELPWLEIYLFQLNIVQAGRMGFL